MRVIKSGGFFFYFILFYLFFIFIFLLRGGAHNRIFTSYGVRGMRARYKIWRFFFYFIFLFYFFIFIFYFYFSSAEGHWQRDARLHAWYKFAGSRSWFFVVILIYSIFRPSKLL